MRRTPHDLGGRERGLFAGTGVELYFAREIAYWRYRLEPDALESFATTLGPLVKAQRPCGSRSSLVPQDYLLTLGVKE
jgi:hypothetical protein